MAIETSENIICNGEMICLMCKKYTGCGKKEAFAAQSFAVSQALASCKGLSGALTGGTGMLALLCRECDAAGGKEQLAANLSEKLTSEIMKQFGICSASQPKTPPRAHNGTQSDCFAQIDKLMPKV